MNLTVPTAMLGELVSAHATVNYDTLPSDGMGQATLDLHLEGEDDTLTLELGTMPDAAERAAELLRDLARELDGEAASYEYVPEQWDGFVGLDRHVGWGASLEGKRLELPRGVSESGAIVALALACREAGYFPNLWIDRYGRGGDDAITTDTLASAAAEVLAVTEWDEPGCEYCSDPIVKTDEGWTHLAFTVGDYHGSPRSPLCHVAGGWELEDGEEETTATPYRELDEDAVRSLLDEVCP